MKVAVLIGTISASYGGPAYSVRRLWQSAERKGVDVTVHSTDTFHVSETASDRANWRPLECVQWNAVGIKSLGFSSKMSSGVMSALSGKDSIISQHGLWLHHGRLARKIGNDLRIPVIIHPHGMLEPWALNRSGWKKQIVGRLWEFDNLRRAACLRATSSDELKSIRSFGLKNPVAVIPNGIDVEAFSRLPSRSEAEERFPILRGRRVLLFLSRIHPKKGLPLLLKAWKKVEAERKDWVLAIAGTDESGHTAELSQMADELNLGDSLQFMGALFDKDKLAAYALAELFVLPSYSENFGVAIAEALAAGIPVITTKGTPWQELESRACGWWVEPDENSLEAALSEALATSKESLSEMGRRGRQWMAKDFSWEASASQMVEVCEWTLGEGSAPACVVLN